MSGAITAAVVGAGTAIYGANQGSKAAKAAGRAGQYAADADREALEYLKETERLPQQYREEALTGLNSFYKVPGQALSEEDLIAKAKASPLYSNLLSGKKAGEESILRNASATGGLRSGNVQADLYDYSSRLENEALLQSFNQEQQRDDYLREQNLTGLHDLAMIPSNANNIAQQTAQVGQTRANGLLGQAQTQQAVAQQNINNVSGLLGLGIQAKRAGVF